MLVCIYGMFIMPYKNKHLPNIIYIFLHLFCIIEHKRVMAYILKKQIQLYFYIPKILYIITLFVIVVIKQNLQMKNIFYI
ncbi:hypothetical protein PFTANZ_03526 [Plasmodium falciparum Tanzania (2000708)]|uniref:Uncharacterized protein n=2 Tax=Plasmodium falciparum TaxID=5833 RepID=A0A024W517_PLAFA|nr:hypothetical protein PFFVO_05586 [Plasmodium falciparum Vietnam Oak-Knoll (FVO)]ETW35777.1 hypothetical protein PFTANZ_03526 [Plasmodium falciparum Tanzania (2000708)]